MTSDCLPHQVRALLERAHVDLALELKSVEAADRRAKAYAAYTNPAGAVARGGAAKEMERHEAMLARHFKETWEGSPKLGKPTAPKKDEIHISSGGGGGGGGGRWKRGTTESSLSELGAAPLLPAASAASAASSSSAAAEHTREAARAEA